MKTKKRSWLARVAASFAVVVLALGSVPGGGVDDEAVFELEGNVVDDAAAGTDWATVVGGGGGVLVKSFVTDPKGQGDNILTGGGTKDPNDFNQWQWKQTNTTSVQDKDDLIHVGAVAKLLTNGHTAIYFMADRFDNSGDSQVGFWFAQDSNVGVNNNAQGGASGGFNGHHSDGDFLIVAHFVTGGQAPEIEVFKWSGGALVTVVATNAAKCDPATGSLVRCAITNSGDGVTALAGFQDKSSSTTYGHGEFIEGGIDLQATFGDNIPCVSTFFAETRSSQSLTATLSDFTAPVPFPLCHMSVSKSCTGAKILGDGSSVTYGFNGTVVNDGQGTLYSVQVTDVPPANVIAGSLSLTLNALPDTCTVNAVSTACLKPGSFVSYTGTYNTSSIGGQNHVNATAGSAPGGTNVTASADWPLVNGQPTCAPSVTKGLTLTKACTACLQSANNALKVHIGVTGNVCNTGNTDLDGVTVTDNKMQTILNAIHLEPGGCQAFPTALGYDPTAVDSGTCTFTDTVSATANIPAALGGGSVTATPVTATCTLCTTGACTQ